MTPSSSPPTPVATIINQWQFNAYAAAWAEAVHKGQHLAAAFEPAGYARLQFVTFDYQSVVWLLSTVGARRVKAQFVLVPVPGTDEKPKHGRFSVVLYATDAQDGRISAYYLADNTFTPKALSAPATGGNQVTDFQLAGADDASANGDPASQIPHSLVSIWLKNWPLAQLNPDLFASHYGPLLGYTFELGDFMDPLFYSQTFKQRVLRVGLGVHEYHAALTSPECLTRTFGLVLRMYDLAPKPVASAATQAPSNEPATLDSIQELLRQSLTPNAAADDPGQPFYDLSTPNPPGS